MLIWKIWLIKKWHNLGVNDRIQEFNFHYFKFSKNFQKCILCSLSWKFTKWIVPRRWRQNLNRFYTLKSMMLVIKQFKFCLQHLVSSSTNRKYYSGAQTVVRSAELCTYIGWEPQGASRAFLLGITRTTQFI